MNMKNISVYPTIQGRLNEIYKELNIILNIENVWNRYDIGFLEPNELLQRSEQKIHSSTENNKFTK